MTEQGATLRVTDSQAALLARIIEEWLADGFSSNEAELREAKRLLRVFSAIRPL